MPNMPTNLPTYIYSVGLAILCRRQKVDKISVGPLIRP